MITYETDLERALLKDKERLDFLENEARISGMMLVGQSIRDHIDAAMKEPVKPLADRLVDRLDVSPGEAEAMAQAILGACTDY